MQTIAASVAYREDNRDDLYGVRSLRGKFSIEKVLLWIKGAVKKNIDTVIFRKYKKHGMSWTTEELNNPIKLESSYYNLGGCRHYGKNGQVLM